MKYTESKIKVVYTHTTKKIKHGLVVYTHTTKKIKHRLDDAIIEKLNDTYEAEQGVIEKLEYKIRELQSLIVHIIEEMPKESRKNILHLFDLEEVNNES